MIARRRFILAAMPGLALTGLGQSACQGQAAGAEPPPVSPTPALKDVAPFPVGGCVSTTLLDDPAFAPEFLSQFNQVTPEWEMKMERIWQADGALDFTAADRIADICRSNHLGLHGTTLVWYAQNPMALSPLVGDRAAFTAALKRYVTAVMGRYRGLARGWDVVNEAVAEDGHGYRGGIWEQGLGPDYACDAFAMARQADPDAVLFLNDYNLELNPAKLDSFQRLVERLLKAGAPVTGLGTQSHLNIGMPRGQARSAIEALGRFGLPIHVSELDVSTRLGANRFDRERDRRLAQARIAGELAEAFMALPKAQRYGFTLWGLRDRDSWLRRPPNAGDGSDQPLMFDDLGAPKPMLAALRAAFQGRKNDFQ